MDRRHDHFTIDLAPKGGFLAAYFPVGDPLVPLSRLKAYEAARVDVVELGLRTADPHSDGDVIAASMRRSAGKGELSEAVDAATAVRSFGYAAMGMVFGYATPTLAKTSRDWGAFDGLLLMEGKDVDAEAERMRAVAERVRIARLVPCHMPELAIAAALDATAFVFLQYSAGKTGIRDTVARDLPGRIASLRRAGLTVPILTGIGINSTTQADHAMQSGADGVVVGTKTLEMAIESHHALQDYLCGMRETVDG